MLNKNFKTLTNLERLALYEHLYDNYEKLSPEIIYSFINWTINDVCNLNKYKNIIIVERNVQKQTYDIFITIVPYTYNKYIINYKPKLNQNIDNYIQYSIIDNIVKTVNYCEEINYARQIYTFKSQKIKWLIEISYYDDLSNIDIYKNIYADLILGTRKLFLPRPKVIFPDNEPLDKLIIGILNKRD